ncbi:MAG: hypothetical protein R3C61_20005 [Bacteroidia bacterium]
MALPIDISAISGETINIRLESAYKFWELDQIGLSANWQQISEYVEVPMISAVNEKGEDVSARIHTVDEHYAVQPQAGSAITLSFENTAAEDEIYILKGTGYYHHIRNYEHAPDKPFIRYMRRNQQTVTRNCRF